MERLTYDFCFNGSHSNQVKGADNLTCSEVCEREESCNECPIARAFDRLAAIEDILGDEYDLAHLRELIQADREGRRILISDAPKPGDLVYYRDEDGSKEYGVIGTVFCKDGKLDSFSVDFEDSDFDEFKGTATATPRRPARRSTSWMRAAATRPPSSSSG